MDFSFKTSSYTPSSRAQELCESRGGRPGLPSLTRDQKIKRSRGGRWSWTSKLAHKRSSVGRWSWAAKVKLLSLRVVPQQLCNGHCPCDSAQARQLKQQLCSALVAGQRRGDTALTLPLFWRRSTVSPVFFGRCPWSSPHSEHRFSAPSSKLCQI